MVSIIYGFIALAVLLLFGSLLMKIFGRRRLQLGYNLLLLLGMISMLFYMSYLGGSYTALGVLSVNQFSIFFMLIFTAGLSLVNLLAFTYSDHYADFAVLADFALIGMYLVVLSQSLLTIFIGLELVSIPTVFIVFLSRKSLEAGTKLFIMTSLAIALLSFAMALVYGGANSLALQGYSQNGVLLLASILFIIALGIDSSVFPFNLLIPDIYQGSSAYATSMLGGINKKVAFAALIQIIILSFVTYKSAFQIIAVLSVLTMFYGNIVAMLQNNFKRMLAYSSISQAGYILIGIATQSSAGISASLFQIFSHAFAFIGLLGMVAWLESKNRNNIDDLTGLNSENRFAAFSIALFMLTFVGLPFTTGFIGKFLLFLSAVNANLTWLAVIGIINSIISVYYYARVIIAAYTGKKNARHLQLSRTVLIVAIVTLALTVIFGTYPQPVISLVNGAGAYLFASR